MRNKLLGFLAALFLAAPAIAQLSGGPVYNPAGVAITGGSINGTSIGGTVSASVTASTLNAGTSTLATTTIAGPLTATSTLSVTGTSTLGAITASGNVLPNANNTLSVGASATRFQSIISSTQWLSIPVTYAASTYTVTANDSYVIANNGASSTVTLPTASSFPGRVLMIKTQTAFTVISNASNVVAQTGGAASTAILAATAGKWAELVSDGTNWIIMQSN